MTISLHDATVPVFVRGFRVLSDLLAKAEAQADASVLIDARLAPDMLTLAGQIQRASDTAKFAVARIGEVQPPSFEDNETTFADLRKRIDVRRPAQAYRRHGGVAPVGRPRCHRCR
jgi:uncharacterized protein